MRYVLIAAGFLGFSAIALGAYGDHGLRGHITPENMRSFETAIRYQLLHATTLTALALSLIMIKDTSRTVLYKRLTRATATLLAGSILFSGSIYAKVILGMEAAVKLTPLGGITLMAGWLLILWAGALRSDVKPEE